MKDWKGNEAENGDTILKIAFTDFMSMSTSMAIGFIDREGNLTMSDEVETKRNQLWEVIASKTIHNNPIVIQSETTGIQTITIGEIVPSIDGWHILKSDLPREGKMTFTMDDFSFMQPWHIIAIKGKSDNPEEFFASYYWNEKQYLNKRNDGSGN